MITRRRFGAAAAGLAGLTSAGRTGALEEARPSGTAESVALQRMLAGT